MKAATLFLPHCRLTATHPVDTSSVPAPHPWATVNPIDGLKRLRSWFMDHLVVNNEPHIWTTRDRQGKVIWHTYDPINGRTGNFASELDVRVWLETRYYQ